MTNRSFFILSMSFVIIAAIASSQTVVAVWVFGLMMAGLFVARHYDHPAVREWVEKWF